MPESTLPNKLKPVKKDGAAFKALLQKIGVSVPEFAETWGYDANHIYRACGGRRSVSQSLWVLLREMYIQRGLKPPLLPLPRSRLRKPTPRKPPVKT